MSDNGDDDRDQVSPADDDMDELGHIDSRALAMAPETETVTQDTPDGYGAGADGDDAELVVLDPDHPLMARFQTALKSQLTRQKDKLALELREVNEATKRRTTEREEVGVELYGAQQELARQQMVLEQQHDEYNRLANERDVNEKMLDEARRAYREMQTMTGRERKAVADLMAEVENLHLRLYYMANAKTDVAGDVAVMKRAAEKAGSELGKAETEKQKQDLLVDRLVNQVDKLREEIALYDAQITAQQDETTAARDALNDALTEVSAVTLEKQQLLQQWNSCLIGMRRRDEAHSAMMDALNGQRQLVRSTDTELENLKKAIQSEEEENEKLTSVLTKTENEIGQMKKAISTARAQHDVLKQQYSGFMRIMQETESSLERVNAEKSKQEKELSSLQTGVEKEFQQRVKLETAIMEKIRSKVTQEKYAKYADRLAGEARTRVKNQELLEADLQNKVAQHELNKTLALDENNKKQAVMDEMETSIREANTVITKGESEMNKRMITIEQKQNQIDLLNKKLETLIAAAGGEELGPLEVSIKSIGRSIDQRDEEIAALQQQWLREQNKLVKLTESREAQGSKVGRLRSQLVILSQKKIRTEGEIELQHTEKAVIQREIRNLQNDVVRLNTKIHKQEGREWKQSRQNELQEAEFVRELHEAETEAVAASEELDALKEEKEHLLQQLVDSERQVQLWEKKIQLAREMKTAVDTDIGAGEIGAMRFEIHRMEVRYQQLLRQQEKLIVEMEKSVSRRDTIAVRGEANTKNKAIVTKTNLERQLVEQRKKIKKTSNDTAVGVQQLAMVKEEGEQLVGSLETRQQSVRETGRALEAAEHRLADLSAERQRRLEQLLSLQQRAKWLQQARDGKYTRVCKDDDQLPNESSRAADRTRGMATAVNRVVADFEQLSEPLRPLADQLNRAVQSLPLESSRTDMST